MSLYHQCAKSFGWTPKEIDETNIETLIDFITYTDPNERIINGKVYKRAQGVPKWL